MRKPPFAKRASVKLVLVLLGLVVVFNLFIMPSLGGEEEMIPLDLQFAYTPERAYELVDSYSDITRKQYVIGEMTLDVAYPIVYTLFMSITLMLLYPNNWKLAWLPYGIFTADMFENIGIVALLLNYPKQLAGVAWMTSGFSTIKWTLVFVVVVSVLAGLFFTIIKRLKKRNSV